MIVINAPLQRDKIIEALDGYTEDGTTFTLKEQKGMKIFFETNHEDLVVAARMAREHIKAQPWGSVLYFQAEAAK